MDDETYESLKKVIAYAERKLHEGNIKESFSNLLNVNQIKDWISETEKEHIN